MSHESMSYIFRDEVMMIIELWSPNVQFQ